MKVVIFGGRDFSNYETAIKVIEKIIDLPNCELIDGRATGADYLNVILSKKYMIKKHDFPADWKKHGKAAGPIRNKQMASFCDLGIGFWDGESAGTMNMYKELRRQGKGIYLFDYNGNNILGE